MARGDYCITIEPGPLSGYFVRIDGQIAAGFTNAADLARWIEQEYAALDLPPSAPVLQSEHDSPPGKRGVVAHLLRGGRT